MTKTENSEKHENTALPKAVAESMAKRFPTWAITSDVYLVNYQEGNGISKVWKILLGKGDMRLKVKTNEKGEVIE